MKLKLLVLSLMTITSTAMAEGRLTDACIFSVTSVSGELPNNPVVLKSESSSALTESVGAASANQKAYARVRTLNATRNAMMTIYIGEAKARSQVMPMPGQGELKVAFDGDDYLLKCDIKN